MRLFVTTLALWACTSMVAQAALIDTFTRADGLPADDSLGATEVGNFDYVERDNTANLEDTAAIANNQLHIFGDNSVAGGKGTGGAYFNNGAADVTVSMDMYFKHSSSTIAAADRFASDFLLELRSRPGQLFGTTNSEHNGMVGIEISANGDLLIREQFNGLATVASGINPFTGGGITRTANPGQLPATFGNGNFDVNQDGYLDETEPINFKAELNGQTLKLFVNDLQFGNDYSVSTNGNAFGNGIGLHKNRIASSFNISSDIFIDNLNVSPVPEPASLAMLGVAMFVLPTVRRRRRWS